MMNLILKKIKVMMLAIPKMPTIQVYGFYRGNILTKLE